MVQASALEPSAGDRLARRNVAVLCAAQAMGNSSNSIVIATGGLVGMQLASDPAFATVPVTTFVLGSAFATVPASLLMQRVGRRRGFMVGAIVAMSAGLVGSLAVSLGAFALFCLGTFLAGAYSAFVQYYRFAAADTASEAFKPKAISWVLAGGIMAGFIGPQIVIFTKDTFAALFAATYLAQTGLAILAFLLVMRVSIPLPSKNTASGSGRPLSVIVRQPRFIVAALCCAASFALMNFVMTSSPLAMVGHGHSIDHAALGIQWHLIAMFAPSLFTGSLIARFGKTWVVATGFLLYAASGVVGLAGMSVTHFWVALILLGLAWNLSYIGATAMVTDCYRPEERGRAQAANDLTMWTCVAIASLASGVVMTSAGWFVVNVVMFPVAAICLVALAWATIAQRPRAQAS